MTSATFIPGGNSDTFQKVFSSAIEDNKAIIVPMQILGGNPLNTALTVGVTALAAPTTALANRRKLFIQNDSANRNVYVGGSAVTTVNGILIIKNGGSIELDVTEDSNWFVIADGANADVRILEVPR